MTITISESVVKNAIKNLIMGHNYRIEIVNLINEEFLRYTIYFLKKIVEAKLKNSDINIDWYKKEFINDTLPSADIAVNSGLNKKTISNMYNSTKKEIILEAANEHYDVLYQSINGLVKSNNLNLNLELIFRDGRVNLNINETLLVINTLSVKRSTLRGGFWSTAGKQIEKRLMIVLCEIYEMKKENYKIMVATNHEKKSPFAREIDFCLSSNKKDYKCEVKLMGKGNPESVDAVIARGTDIFIADKLSITNKKQLNSLKIDWIELQGRNYGYKKFPTILEKLKIPFTDFNGDVSQKIEEIFSSDIFNSLD